MAEREKVTVNNLNVRYVLCTAREVPGTVRFDVPKSGQGQMIEVAYGTFGRYEAGPGDPCKRVTNLATREVALYKLVEDA